MGWAFESLDDNSMELSTPEGTIDEYKRFFQERQPFLKKKSIEAIEGGGRKFYYRWNSDTINRLRYAMSTDDLSSLTKVELELWNSFVEYQTSYSFKPLDGYIGCTTIDENGYSYCIDENLQVDLKNIGDRPLRLSPHPINENALDELFMMLIDSEDLDIISIKEIMTEDIPCITSIATNYVWNEDSVDEGLLTKDLINPLVDDNFKYPKEQVVEYHNLTKRPMIELIRCPINAEMFLTPCSRDDTILTTIDSDKIITTNIDGNPSLSFDNNLATYWNGTPTKERIYLDVEFQEEEFIRFMTITAQETNIDLITKDFKMYGWDEKFKAWVTILERKQIVDGQWIASQAIELALIGSYHKKIRFEIFDNKPCLGGNIIFYSNRPNIAEVVLPVLEYNCDYSEELQSVFVSNLLFDRTVLGNPLCMSSQIVLEFIDEQYIN